MNSHIVFESIIALVIVAIIIGLIRGRYFIAGLVFFLLAKFALRNKDASSSDGKSK